MENQIEHFVCNILEIGDLPNVLEASICRFGAGPSLNATMPTKAVELLVRGCSLVVGKEIGDFD